MPEVVASTSKDGGSFHEPECHFASRTTPENRVTLDSPDVAEEEGYRPCTFCFPERREKRRRGPAGGPRARDATPEEDRHERGVWSYTFTDAGGQERFAAIDSRGRLVATACVVHTDTRDAVIRSMRRLLDAIDPVGWQERKRAVERREGLELIH